MTPRGGSRGRRRLAAFSLVEIITVLALFGLIAGLVMSGTSAMLRGTSADDVESVTLSAIASARRNAVLTGHLLELNYDEKARLLQWGGDQATLAGEDEVRLLPPVSSSSVLIRGKLVEKAITRVRFYADGTCDPFRLEIVRQRVSRYVAIDPWTCTALANPGTEKR